MLPDECQQLPAKGIMKLLLDEQIDVRLKSALAELDVYTLMDMGWQGLKNGVLSEKINEGAFAFFITADKNLPFQQNLRQAVIYPYLVGYAHTFVGASVSFYSKNNSLRGRAFLKSLV